ncbi:hypothetical protein [Leptolyngbya sp. FACHB-261]|uniref:hypothetical protein n=1 Tax=Leptolyngbya sp. FACHB-261 TaxID=2692806 RepID=UPI001684BB06|nr:hypothetical protein [Leptolyngbya sp. FACHB-261]MBD2099900.1 hypothetical protein [Leptolyngbya sp. FACHB-261]
MASLALDPKAPQGQSRLQQILTASLMNSLDLVQPRSLVVKQRQEQLQIKLSLTDPSIPEKQARLQSLALTLEQQLHRLNLLGVSQVCLQFLRNGELAWEHSFGYKLQNTAAPNIATTKAAPAQSSRQPASTPSKGKFRLWLEKQGRIQKARHLANPVAAGLEDAAVLLGLVLAVLLLQQAGTLLRDPLKNYRIQGSSDFIEGVRPESAGVSVRNYLAIQRGMRYGRVKQILGGEGLVVSTASPNAQGLQQMTLLWQTPQSASATKQGVSVSVTFLGSEVIDKSMQQFNP